MSVFRDTISLITGGASGIGRAIGTALAAQGARVVLVDINCDGLEAACQAITDAGGQARWLELDVTDSASLRRVVDDVYATEGPIDYLFNNAGIALFGEAHEMTAAQWQRLLAVNIHGVVNGVAEVYPRMVARGSGHVVNIASVVGLVPFAGGTAYSMTKHAVVGLSESLRGEGARHGVRVTVACPGIIDTNLKNTVELLGLDREKMMTDPRVSWASADGCARVILRGVRRNRSVVTVTAQARIAWWMYRFAPGFFASWLGLWGMRMSQKRFASADPAAKE